MKNEITNTTYAEHTDDPKTWAAPRPGFDLEKFNRELERRCGTIGSIPRFRCRWAPDTREDLYLLEDFDVLIGYGYRENGVEKFVSCNDGDFELPDNAVWWSVTENHKVWVPRFVIEEYRPMELTGDRTFYHKVWFVETVELLGKEYGRVDLLSRYREPSEVDIQKAEKLRHLRDTLTDDQIRDGLAREDALELRRKLHDKEQMKAEMAEDVAKALTDGLPNAKKFGFNPNLKVDILEHSKKLVKEHNKTI